MVYKFEKALLPDKLRTVYRESASVEYWQRKLDAGEIFFIDRGACVRLKPSTETEYRGSTQLFERVKKQDVADLYDEVARWLRNNTECRVVYGKIPVNKPAFLAIAKLAKTPKRLEKSGIYIKIEWIIRGAD